MGRVGSPVRVGGDAVGAAASELSRRADGLAEQIAESISAAHPELAHDAALVASNRSNLLLGFSMLADGVPGERAVPPPEARRYAHEVAHRVESVEALLGAYRVGCRSFWREWSACVTERLPEPADALAALKSSTAFVLGYHRALSTRIAREFALGRSPARPAPTASANGVRLAGDVTLESLLNVDGERTRRFVEQTLGELAAADDTALRLRATLRILFEEGLNQARTARRLNLHHNTIAYRIRRAEQLLGRSIAERRLELEVALALADAPCERQPEA